MAGLADNENKWFISNYFEAIEYVAKDDDCEDNWFFLKFIFDHKLKNRDDNDWTKQLCEKAVLEGSIKTLQYLRDKGCQWDINTIIGSIVSGSINCLKYAHIFGQPNNIPEDFDINTTLSYDKCCYNVNRDNDIGIKQCLQFIVKHKYPWISKLCHLIAWGNNIQSIKYIYESMSYWNSKQLEIEFNEGTFANCCTFNEDYEKSVFKFLEDQGCKWDNRIILPIIYDYDDDRLKYVLTKMKRHPQVDIENYKLTPKIYYESNDHNHFDPFSYFNEYIEYELQLYKTINGIKDDVDIDPSEYISWDYTSYEKPISQGQMYFIEFLQKKGCKLTKEVVEYAVKHDNLEALEFLFSHNCEYPNNVCEFAIEHDSFDCLKYLIDHNIDYNLVDCLIIASDKDNEYILNYLQTL